MYIHGAHTYFAALPHSCIGYIERKRGKGGRRGSKVLSFPDPLQFKRPPARTSSLSDALPQQLSLSLTPAKCRPPPPHRARAHLLLRPRPSASRVRLDSSRVTASSAVRRKRSRIDKPPCLGSASPSFQPPVEPDRPSSLSLFRSLSDDHPQLPPVPPRGALKSNAPILLRRKRLSETATTFPPSRPARYIPLPPPGQRSLSFSRVYIARG